MRTWIALYDAPLPAAAALCAVADAGCAPADVDALPAPPGGLPQAGDWAAEVALHAARLAPEDRETARAAAVAASLVARGVPADRAAAAAARVAAGRGWLVAVACPDAGAAAVERALSSAAPLALLGHLHPSDSLA